MRTTSMMMMKLLVVLSLAWLAFCKTKEDKNSADFDFFYFVQQWPGSYCDAKGHSCCYPDSGKPKADFTIHGLWPNYNDGSYPSSCDNANSFDESQLDDLENELKAKWPSFTCPSIGRKFWAHEWNKHGTCAESILDQRDYFQAALDLKNRTNLLQALKDAGIEPSNKEFYNLEDIKEAIKEANGFYPWIQCNQDQEGNSQLYQVYVCVDRNGKDLIKCPVIPQGNCAARLQFPTFLLYLSNLFLQKMTL